MFKEERETVIRWDDAEDMATVWSNQRKMLNKIHKLGYRPYRVWGEGEWFRIPKTLCSGIRRPRSGAKRGFKAGQFAKKGVSSE